LSTHTYAITDLTAEADAAMYGTSRLRTASSRLYLAYNRPLVDSNHVLYSRLNDGTGTSVIDDSANNNTASLGGSGAPVWCKLASSPSVLGNAVHFVLTSSSIGATSTMSVRRHGRCTAGSTSRPRLGGQRTRFSNVDQDLIAGSKSGSMAAGFFAFD
jgi:hypothetical protein